MSTTHSTILVDNRGNSSVRSWLSIPRVSGNVGTMNRVVVKYRFCHVSQVSRRSRLISRRGRCRSAVEGRSRDERSFCRSVRLLRPDVSRNPACPLSPTSKHPSVTLGTFPLIESRTCIDTCLDTSFDFDTRILRELDAQ